MLTGLAVSPPLSRQHIDAAAQAAALYPRIRYMGSKYKLLPQLAEVFAEVGGQTALDAFSGSGVVAYLLKRQGFTVTANDMLEFPGVLASATVVNNSTQLTAADVVRITGPAADGRDFVRKTFTGVFFTPDDLAFIDSAWSHIAAMDGDKRAIAISALILSAARKQPRGVFTISGDLSNYDDGRRDLHLPMRDHFVEHVEDYNRAVFAGQPAQVTRQEASQMETRPFDVVYLDPPYAPPSDDNCYLLVGQARHTIGRQRFLRAVEFWWRYLLSIGRGSRCLLSHSACRGISIFGKSAPRDMRFWVLHKPQGFQGDRLVIWVKRSSRQRNDHGLAPGSEAGRRCAGHTAHVPVRDAPGCRTPVRG